MKPDIFDCESIYKHRREMTECPSVWLTCDNGGHAPADGVVEPHGAVVDVALLRLHAVDVEALHEHPGKRGHEEVVQQDGHNRTQKLHRRECKEESNYGKQAVKKRVGGL